MNIDHRTILISDPTLRDGNHAVSHQLCVDQIKKYCIAADIAGVPIVEVGHGNGLGASSMQVGLAKVDDKTILKVARRNLKRSKLGIHAIPGFATIERDLKPAIDSGVDVFRIASHCSEADTTQKHIQFCSKEGKTVFGVLMMSHMEEKEILSEEAKKMIDYGAEAVVLMDSSGNYLPEDVIEKITFLKKKLSINVGFHAHNNLGMAIANSVAAIQAGASIVDGCARGFGAGAGNTQLEVLVAVLNRMGYETGIDLHKILAAGDIAENFLIEKTPTINSTSVVSGLSGIFSGFLKPVNRIASKYSVDPMDILFTLGQRKIVAGQEDIIIEVAESLAKKER